MEAFLDDALERRVLRMVPQAVKFLGEVQGRDSVRFVEVVDNQETGMGEMEGQQAE
jgi:hypothetical protein